MAAICGIHAAGTDGKAALATMLGTLAGGTAHSDWPQASIGLGCRETATGESSLVVDRAAGLTLVADARLDDRDGLCDALGVPVAERRSIADGQLILRAWSRWGRDCPRDLLGDYAFALWDARRHLLFCARDHAGARPFYYALPKDGIVFASAVEPVLGAPDVGDALDEAVVATQLASRHCSDARSFFAAVRKLPPGHALCVEWALSANGTMRPKTNLARHWRPELAPVARPAADDEYAEQFRHLLAQAVRDRLRGCEPGAVGTHLSGGLDSSSIAVVASRQLRRQGHSPPLAFSWLPRLEDAPPKAEHEREYALVDAVCAQEGIEVIHGTPSAADFLDVLGADGALPGIHLHINEEVVQRNAVARGVNVLLSGWGGDECISFNGRGHWQALLLRGRWRRLAAECRAQDAAALRFLGHVVLPILHPLLVPSLAGQRDWPSRKRWLIDPAFSRRVKPLAAPGWREIGVCSTQLRLLQAGHLVDRIEGWAASGARRGIEYRYPLLDRRLLEFALGLPPEQFRRGRWGRWLFRHGCRTLLPPEVCWNRLKADPARSETTQDAFVEAFPAIRQRLVARTPSRASYVDMQRLLERLDAARFRAKPEPGPMIRALQLLDF